MSPAQAKKRGLASRRRRQDDGEEESSLVGDVEDDSLSEGSGSSLAEDDADVDASEASDDHDNHKPTVSKQLTTGAKSTPPSTTGHQQPKLGQSTDNAAMLNGLQYSAANDAGQELGFDDAEPDADASDSERPPGDVPRAPLRETQLQRSRREHQEYLKQRDANPAFVPNRGGFFLHDDRSSTNPSFWNKQYGRGRGRPVNGPRQIA
jgi:hypothetical protein